MSPGMPDYQRPSAAFAASLAAGGHRGDRRPEPASWLASRSRETGLAGAGQASSFSSISSAALRTSTRST